MKKDGRWIGDEAAMDAGDELDDGLAASDAASSACLRSFLLSSSSLLLPLPRLLAWPPNNSRHITPLRRTLTSLHSTSAVHSYSELVEHFNFTFKHQFEARDRSAAPARWSRPSTRAKIRILRLQRAGQELEIPRSREVVRGSDPSLQEPVVQPWTKVV